MKNRLFPPMIERKVTENKHFQTQHQSLSDNLSWLSTVGIIMNDETPNYTASIAQIEANLTKYINNISDTDYQKICTDLSSFFTDISTVSKLLIQNQPNTPSLLRLLLTIPQLQEKLIQSIGDFFQLTCFMTNTKKIRSIAFDIVRDLSFLPYIKNHEQLTDMLFNSILNCHQDIKEILLSYLFLLIDSNDDVIDRLFRIMTENEFLVCDILTSIENFTLTTENQDKIRNYVLKNILPSASTKTIPTVIKFLIKTTDQTNASITVDSFRENLVVITKSIKEDILTFSDADFFIIIELKNGLQVNSHFCKSYLLTLEFLNDELNVLDVWVIYCLYSLYPMKTKAQQIITKLSNKTLTTKSIIASVIGHFNAIRCLLYSMIEMMNWMLINNNTNVSRNGIALASVLFEETKDLTTLQDIIGALLIQIEIGDEKSKNHVLTILNHLSIEQPDKLKQFVQLIQSILYNDLVNYHLYQIVCTILFRLVIQTKEDIGQNPQLTQLTISFNKMISTNKMKERGIIGSVCFINRLDEIGLIDYLIDQFHFILSLVIDDPISVLTFYKYLNENSNRSENFKGFLVKHLSEQLYEMFTTKNIGSDYGIIEISNKSIEFHLNKNKYITYSLIYSSYGLSLLLDCSNIIDKDIFGCSFVLKNEKIDVQVTCLLFIQSFLMQLLNFFNNSIEGKYVVLRIEQLIEVEDRLIEKLALIDNYTNPFFGKMFNKHQIALKKVGNSSHFIEKFHSNFPISQPNFFSILYMLPLPLTDLHLRVVLRIVIEYLYGLQNDQNCESLKVVKYLSNEILLAVLNDDRPLSQIIIEKIFSILCIEFSLPRYKNQTNFNLLLDSCSSGDNRSICFKKFAKIMVKFELNENSKISLLKLLNSVLHDGPSEEVDILSHDSKILCKLSKNILKSTNPILSKNGVRTVLPIFLNQKKNVLKEITYLITTAFPDVMINSNESNDWPSLTILTFPTFFNSCFSIINIKLFEAKKKIRSNVIQLTREFVSAVLNRLIKLSLLIKSLSLIVIDSHVTSNVYRTLLKHGSNYVCQFTELLSFLVNARKFDVDEVDEVLDINNQICKNLNEIVDYVRINEQSVHNLLPAISKSLAIWNYSLKSHLSELQ